MNIKKLIFPLLFFILIIGLFIIADYLLISHHFNLLLIMGFSNLLILLLVFIISKILKNEDYLSTLPFLFFFNTFLILVFSYGYHQLGLFIYIPLILYLIIELINMFTNLANQKYHFSLNYLRNNKKHDFLIILLVHILLRAIIYYLVNLPLISYLDTITNNKFSNDYNLSSILSLIIILMGLIGLIFTVIRKLKNIKGLYQIEGPYKNSRYPDVLFTLLIYIGFFLLLLSINQNMWVLFLSPLSYFLFMVFFDIPIYEKTLSLLDNHYIERIKNTNLLWIFRKKQ